MLLLRIIYRTRNKDRLMTGFAMTWKAHGSGTVLLVWEVGGREQVVEGSGGREAVGGSRVCSFFLHYIS